MDLITERQTRVAWHMFGPVDEIDELAVRQFDQSVEQVHPRGWKAVVVVAVHHREVCFLKCLQNGCRAGSLAGLRRGSPIIGGVYCRI